MPFLFIYLCEKMICRFLFNCLVPSKFGDKANQNHFGLLFYFFTLLVYIYIDSIRKIDNDFKTGVLKVERVEIVF
jgi:hypothetical protein